MWSARTAAGCGCGCSKTRRGDDGRQAGRRTAPSMPCPSPAPTPAPPSPRRPSSTGTTRGRRCPRARLPVLLPPRTGPPAARPDLRRGCPYRGDRHGVRGRAGVARFGGEGVRADRERGTGSPTRPSYSRVVHRAPASRGRRWVCRGVRAVLGPGMPGRVLVEGVHDGPVGGGLFGRIEFASVAGRREFGDDLSGGGQVRETRFGLGECAGQVPYPAAEFIGRGDSTPGSPPSRSPSCSPPAGPRTVARPWARSPGRPSWPPVVKRI